MPFSTCAVCFTGVIAQTDRLDRSMPKFFNSDIAELAHQLTLSPRRLRMEQIHGIEKLLGLIDRDRAYPFEFVCYLVTQYKKRGPASTAALIPGKALIRDLITMAEVISRKAQLAVAELNEPCQTQQQLSEELHVSTKTIRRWRNHGLLGVRVVFEDGVNRLAFCRRTIDRFVVQNKDLVERGAAFTQLTAAERNRIVARAQKIVSEHPLKLHAVARVIAEESGRAVETVRYTLRRHDEANRSAPLFNRDGASVHCERHLAVWRCHAAGEDVAAISRAFDCSVEEVERILRDVQVREWQTAPPEHIHNELFDAPNAGALILEVPEPARPDAPAPRVPQGLPAYLRSLYLTPLLTREQEQDVFRRYNYLKYKAALLVKSLDPQQVTAEQIDRVCGFLARIDELKQRIIQANLRLVVSVAKRHVGWSANFFEVVSDGNISLMRAVEKFDYALGNKFSTYATWAIMKNYARSIPEQHYQYARFVTGQESLLDAAADRSAQPIADSDRRRVREMITEGLDELDEREREIVSGHFGLSSPGSAMTLEQLGKRFGVTKERVRQIEQRALARLREVLAPSLVDVLSD